MSKTNKNRKSSSQQEEQRFLPRKPSSQQEEQRKALHDLALRAGNKHKSFELSATDRHECLSPP